MNGPGVFAFWENVCGFGAADELAVLRFGTLEDGLTPADDVPYGLAAYVFTQASIALTPRWRGSTLA